MNAAYCFTYPSVTITSAAKVIALVPVPLPIPLYPQYSISPCGFVYRKGYRLHQVDEPHRGPRVRISANGKKQKVSLARLVALTHVPNPGNHTHYIFIDRDYKNCNAENIQWVSDTEYRKWINEKKAHRSHSAELPRIAPKREKPCFDLGGVPVHGFPGYFITKDGVVYKTDRIIKPMAGNRGCLRVKLRYPIQKRQYMRAGLATLVAEHFVPNLNRSKNKYVIFKDRNRLNCHAENLAWVDGQTFMHYSGVAKSAGGLARKIYIERSAAISQCIEPMLKRYYQTLDDYYLLELWKDIDRRIAARQMSDWPELRSETYLYYLDRCQRYSFLRDPLPLLMLYLRTLRRKLREEISPDIPVAKLYKLEESLRSGNYSRADRSGNWQYERYQ
jgi:hypothetical protein